MRDLTPQLLVCLVLVWNGSVGAHDSPSQVYTTTAATPVLNPTQRLRNIAEDLTLADLVSHLLGLTSGQHFYLVYDNDKPGVADVARVFHLQGDTTLLPYDPTFHLLTETLRSYNHVQVIRNIFVFCRAAHVTHLFEQVRLKVLESPTIRWFVIVEEDLTEDVQDLLREGTQVALVQRITPQKALLFSSRVDPDGQIRFHLIESWSLAGAVSGRSQRVRGELVPDLQQLYSNLHGRQLLVTTNNNRPFFTIKELQNGTVIPISGVDYKVISTLSETLNFTYRIIRPPDGKWGGPQPDNTITGLIGQVARHEAHVALCELTITSSRETVVDFTTPYYMESTTLVSPAPKKKNRSFAVFSPFTLEVWLCICLVTVLVGPVLYLVTRLLVMYFGEEDSVHFSLQSLSFNMYRNLMVQNNLIQSHHWSLRFIFFCWYLFSFYVYAMYSGTLTSVLAIPAFETPIDSLHELAQAHDDGHIISTTRDTSFEAALKVRDKKYVFINAQLNSKMKAAQYGREYYYIARHTFLPQCYGIACSSGSPFKDVFSRILIRLTEAGLVYKWAYDEVNNASPNFSVSGLTGPIAINLQHLQAAFFILLLGFTISAIVLGVEIIAIRWCQGIKTTQIEKKIFTTSSASYKLRFIKPETPSTEGNLLTMYYYNTNTDSFSKNIVYFHSSIHLCQLGQNNVVIQ
ncbi:glutamate receptor ionotropic, delta-2-like isoform X2 [Panulirus ornatus]|uniref:glutamate receptor ionotropic, delta-2-like isoform X2 n=1 Tax=Panulirus ornatus TaxID=150431 RepID=UPI003A8A81F5